MLKAIILYENEQFDDVVQHLENTLQNIELLKNWEQLWVGLWYYWLVEKGLKYRRIYKKI